MELFKYASFGVPRAFITLLRSYRYHNLDEKNTQSRFNTVIEQQVKFVETEYLSISQKLLQYKRVIETGFVFFKKIIEEIKEDNRNLLNEKNIIVGISSDTIENHKLLDRMIRFLLEAGLLYEETPVKHGEVRKG